MKHYRKTFGALAVLAFLIISQEVFAQGPPINTDTPIMLGLQGRGIRTFGKIIRKATLLKDGDEIADPLEQRVTVWITPVAVPYNLFKDKFQLGVIIPFMKVDLNTSGKDISSSGIGDLRVFAKYLVYHLHIAKVYLPQQLTVQVEAVETI